MKNSNIKKQKSRKNKARLANKNILVCVSGSIAAYKACDVISALRKKGAEITCLMTESAKNFITPLTLKSLSGNRVYSDMFGEGEWKKPLHTSIADMCDLVLILPASCDIIARLAHGIADDLVSCTCVSTKAKILIVPAMNDNMWNHPLTRENIKKLESIGYEFVEPEIGHLLCGRRGVGHIASQDTIVNRVEKILQ